jgi:hypothetical protein
MAFFSCVVSSSEAFRTIILPVVYVFSDKETGHDLATSRLGLLALLCETLKHLAESGRALIEECIAALQLFQCFKCSLMSS